MVASGRSEWVTKRVIHTNEEHNSYRETVSHEGLRESLTPDQGFCSLGNAWSSFPS